MRKNKKVISDDRMFEVLIHDYDEKCRTIEDFTQDVKDLVENLLNAANLPVHSVTARVKDKESIREKFKKATEEKYQQLSDITDLCGIRIITFFADEVDAVAHLIQKEFDIDHELSVDKRILLDPDRFGYLSLHYIAKLSPSRLRLPEYNRFHACQAEIQIRSILQHTWAEIEHDLGYKTKLAVPQKIRRRFSQLAGLLELTDDMFSQIRDNLADYAKNVSNQIKEIPESVQIDQASLLSFLSDSTIVHQIDKVISSKLNMELAEEISIDFLSKYLSRLDFLNIRTIANLENTLLNKKDRIIEFAITFISSEHTKEDIAKGSISLIRPISILYLNYLLFVENSTDLEHLINILRESGVRKDSARSFAKRLLSAYKKLEK